MLNKDMLKRVAGGVCWDNCPGEGTCGHKFCGTVGWENHKGCFSIIRLNILNAQLAPQIVLRLFCYN